MIMKPGTTTASPGMLLGYARAGAGRRSLESQIDELTDGGVEPNRIYSDNIADLTTARPGLSALLDYARAGDTTVVVGIDRLGRTIDEVFVTARELARRHIGIRSLDEGVDSTEVAGGMIVGVLASLAELDDENRPVRQSRATHPRPDSTAVGRPRALDDDQVALAERMRARGDSVPTIATRLGVSRATLYRSLAERRSVR
jgi:DNA invertase Pin-like site-specific DNA recombinase